jgi:hypothetical protein
MCPELQFSVAVRLNENREFSLPRRTGFAPNWARLGSFLAKALRGASFRVRRVRALSFSASRKGFMAENYVTCSCQNCDQNIEFDLNEFEGSSKRGGTVYGQSIPCPHCGQQTALFVPPPRTKATPVPIPKLTKCPDCEKSVSINALSCPHCGCVLKEQAGVFAKTFKVIVSIIIILIIAYLIFCVGMTVVATHLIHQRQQEYQPTSQTP